VLQKGADNEDVGEDAIHFAVHVSCCTATGLDNGHSWLDVHMAPNRATIQQAKHRMTDALCESTASVTIRYMVPT
jgi:hypothetical protein